MKLVLKSKQDYGTHSDEFTEEFDCSVSEENNNIKINFENGSILIEENKITHERGNNKMVIEPGKVHGCDYETENGMIVLDIKGLNVEKFSNELKTIAKAKYQIIIVGIEPYINEIEIMVI